MVDVIYCFFIVCFYFVKEKILRIKPKEDKFVFVVIEAFRGSESIVGVFSELQKAKEFSFNIKAYSIRPYKIT